MNFRKFLRIHSDSMGVKCKNFSYQSFLMVPMGLILSEQGPAQLLVIERYELTFIFVTGFRTVFGPVKDRNGSDHQSVVFRFLCVEVASKGEPEIYLKSRSKLKNIDCDSKIIFLKP